MNVKSDIISASERDLLSRPVALLTLGERSIAFAALDKLDKHNRSQPWEKSGGIIIQDKDILLKDGVKSPASGQTYSNRREWNEHLRARNLVEIGNDYNNAHEKKKELRGDYNCREALVAATKEVLTKQKYK